MNAAKQTKALPTSSRYRLIKCIASGGMGAVYVGTQRGAAGFERQVAIKRPHGHVLEDPQNRAMILEEAKNASSVRHPNVVSIDDVEEIDGELLLVMNFIEGGSLAQILATGEKLPLGIALRIVLDSCAGLDAIHSAVGMNGETLGLVHRDISPQNVMVGADGISRIADFGIAKRVGDPRRTAKTTRRGKYGYMSPEYLKTGTTTAGSDLFALGVVLWESIACKRLFRGETNFETIKLMNAAEIPSLRAIDENVTEELEEVVYKALAKNPDDRFASVRAFGAALENAARSIVATRADVANFVAATIEPTSALPGTEDIHSGDLVSGTHTVPNMTPVFTTPPSSEPQVAEAEGPSNVRRLHPAFRLDTERMGAFPPPPAMPKNMKAPVPAAAPKASRYMMIALAIAACVATTAIACAGGNF